MNKSLKILGGCIIVFIGMLALAYVQATDEEVLSAEETFMRALLSDLDEKQQKTIRDGVVKAKEKGPLETIVDKIKDSKK